MARSGADTEGVGFDAPHNLLAWAASVLAAAMKDKAYQDATLIGPHVREFVADNHRRLSTRTLDSYEETLGYLCLRFPNRELRDLTAQDLKDWIRERWGHLTPATERQRTAAVKSFFKWAEEDVEIIERNPARKLRPPKVEGGTDRDAYPPDVIDQLRDAQPSLRDRIAIQLFGDLGLRRNELRLLKLEDITVQTGAIRIRNGKGGKQRTVFPTPRLAADLDEYLTWEQPESVYLLWPQGNPQSPYTDTGIHYWYQRCLKRAGLQRILLHELRHSAATNLYESSNDIVAAQKLLGHSSLKTTSTYLHADEDRLRAAMNGR